MNYQQNITSDAIAIVQLMETGVKDEHYEDRRNQPEDYKQMVSERILEISKRLKLIKMNLVEGIQIEMNRVRGLITEYEDPSLNGAGKFAAAMMRASIARAEKCIAYGDVIEYLKVYADLQSYTG